MSELAGLATLRGMWAILIHANVRLPLGPLKWLLGAPELHHWHHRLARESQNFGNVAPWCDVVFGTHHPGTEAPETYPLGVPGEQPQTYLGLLLWPFRRQKSEGLEGEAGAVNQVV